MNPTEAPDDQFVTMDTIEWYQQRQEQLEAAIRLALTLSSAGHNYSARKELKAALPRRVFTK